GGHRGPENARNVAEEAVPFDVVLVEVLFGSEMHCRAFRKCSVQRRSRTTYRPTVTLWRSTHVDSFTGPTSSAALPDAQEQQSAAAGPSDRRRSRSRTPSVPAHQI